MGAGALAPGRVCTEFPKDKEFRAFEMLEKIGVSLKPRRCGRPCALSLAKSSWFMAEAIFAVYGILELPKEETKYLSLPRFFFKRINIRSPQLHIAYLRVCLLPIAYCLLPSCRRPVVSADITDFSPQYAGAAFR